MPKTGYLNVNVTFRQSRRGEQKHDDRDINGQEPDGAVAVRVRKPQPLLPARTLQLVVNNKSEPGLTEQEREMAFTLMAHWGF
jgi:hypothetical protein